MDRLDQAASERAVARLDAMTTGMVLIDVDSALSRSAGELAARRALCGYDAVHLATALSLTSDALVFATWDRALAVAAGSEGLRVAPR
jgi:predicted nucleic acid-binding protein